MTKKDLAIHETLEIHEILTMKRVGLVKAYTVSPLVKDEQLKKLIDQDVKDSEQAIEELQKLLK